MYVKVQTHVNGVNGTKEIDRVTLGAHRHAIGDSQITTFTPRRKQRNGHSRQNLLERGQS